MVWMFITGTAYLAAVWLYRRSAQHWLLLPVLTGTALVLAVAGHADVRSGVSRNEHP